MKSRRSKSVVAFAAGLAAVLACGGAQGVEVGDLKGFEPLYGRYAPGGDCAREPRILVEVSGFLFEVGGRQEKITRPEYAASYGGNFYDGITQWFFPFRTASGFPVLLAFNDGEKPGVLNITGHDEGWAGGPPLAPRNKELVEGSPYLRCK